MPADPFTLAGARRVLEHPDTPAAYVDWAEFIPLTGHEDRTHIGNLLGWSFPNAKSPLGASRAVFERALAGLSEDVLDEWMAALATTPIDDFLDHHVPFLRNVSLMGPDAPLDRIGLDWLRHYEAARREASGPVPKLYRPQPDSVIIEITRSCNFACGMCSSRTGGFLPERTMPLPVFGELVRVLGPTAKSLRVNGYGETTLVPNLSAYLDCLDEFRFGGLREIITNLSAPLEVYEDLFARGFIILASWDATDSGLFEALRRGARYAEMDACLRGLGHVARSQPERLGLLCTVQEANLGEIVPLVRLAAEVGAGLIIFNMVKEPDGSPWMDARGEEIRAQFEEADEEARRLGVALRLPDHIGRARLRLPQTHRSSATFCDRPWRELLIRWDTEATVCNMFNPFSYGVLRRPGPERDVPTRFARLWNGPNARMFRGIINGDSPHPYCRECYFLYP